jgi:hypothetical protein
MSFMTLPFKNGEVKPTQTENTLGLISQSAIRHDPLTNTTKQDDGKIDRLMEEGLPEGASLCLHGCCGAAFR